MPDLIFTPEDVADTLGRRYCDLARSVTGYPKRSFTRQQIQGALAELSTIAAALFVGRTGTFHRIARDVVAEHPVEAGPEWVDRASSAIAQRLLEVARG